MKIKRVGQEWELSPKERFDAWQEFNAEYYEEEVTHLMFAYFPRDIVPEERNENLAFIWENIEAFSRYFHDMFDECFRKSGEYRDFFFDCVKRISERNYLLEDYK